MTKGEPAAGSGGTTRRILAAASEVFARHGYANARVRDIVDAAQVNLAAVNYHFGGKEGLYTATLRHLAANNRPVPLERRGTRPADRLHREIFAILQRYGGARPSQLGRIVLHEAMHPTVHHARLLDEVFRPDVERLRERVAEVAGPGVDSTAAAHAATSVMGQCLFHLFALGDRESIRTLARRITRFSLAGIAGLGTEQSRRMIASVNVAGGET